MDFDFSAYAGAEQSPHTCDVLCLLGSTCGLCHCLSNWGLLPTVALIVPKVMIEDIQNQTVHACNVLRHMRL